MLHEPLSGEQLLDSVLRAHSNWAKAPRAAGAILNSVGKITAFVGIDATTDTAFRIASMTKSFSAAAVLLLRDRGKLSIDIPIAEYAPELRSVVGIGAEPVPITLRHLLTMTSGLVLDDPWADRHLHATDAELDGWIQHGLRFSFPTATAFEYSNLGFGLVGRVVLRVTGETIQKFITRELLVPLGLTRTGFEVRDIGAGTDVAMGMHPTGEGFEEVPVLGDGVIAPMGGLWSTCADLARWVSYLSSAFTPTPQAGPLSAGSRREMQRAHTFYNKGGNLDALGVERGEAGGYGMGLNATVDPNQVQTIWHSGGLPGYGSTMRWWPGGGGVVLLANMTYAPMTAAGASLMSALVARGHADRVALNVSPDLARSSNALVALLNDWDEQRAESLFSDNVALDRAIASRRSKRDEVVGDGPVELLRIEPKSAANGTLVLLIGPAGARREERVFVMLSPFGEPRIQYYGWL